jgi:SAM-dependent methyltransferase
MMTGEAHDANAAQRSYWNTVAGPRWVAAPGFRERRNRESMALLLARLGDIAGHSVLEIGCGTGAMTLPIATAVGEHGRVVAVDISEPMLGAARERVAERGLRNVTLLLGDAQVFDFEPAAFDLATSRMGVMFFADPAAAFRNIAGALKPGGRFVFACWAPRRFPAPVFANVITSRPGAMSCCAIRRCSGFGNGSGSRLSFSASRRSMRRGFGNTANASRSAGISKRSNSPARLASMSRST